MDGNISALKPAGSGANPLALHGISFFLRNPSTQSLVETKGVSI